MAGISTFRQSFASLDDPIISDPSQSTLAIIWRAVGTPCTGLRYGRKLCLAENLRIEAKLSLPYEDESLSNRMIRTFTWPNVPVNRAVQLVLHEGCYEMPSSRPPSTALPPWQYSNMEALVSLRARAMMRRSGNGGREEHHQPSVEQSGCEDASHLICLKGGHKSIRPQQPGFAFHQFNVTSYDTWRKSDLNPDLTDDGSSSDEPPDSPDPYKVPNNSPIRSLHSCYLGDDSTGVPDVRIVGQPSISRLCAERAPFFPAKIDLQHCSELCYDSDFEVETTIVEPRIAESRTELGIQAISTFVCPRQISLQCENISEHDSIILDHDCPSNDMGHAHQATCLRFKPYNSRLPRKAMLADFLKL